MKAFICSLPLLFVTLSAAAPSSSLDKRVAASVTLFTEKDYQGQSYTIDFDVTERTCVARTLPDFMDRQASSLKVTNDHQNWNCQLSTAQDCLTPSPENPNVNVTWFFNWNIANLDFPCDQSTPQECTCTPSQENSCAGYFFDNKARSVLCTSTG